MATFVDLLSSNNLISWIQNVEILLGHGIQIVLWLQQFSPALAIPFRALTFMGDLTFYLIMISLIYWCIDRRLGAQLILLLLLSGYVNAITKVAFDQPRPFTYDYRVRSIVPASEGGMPSGHTQNAVVIWGFLAGRSRGMTSWLIAGFLLIGIPLSRVYLGVHFPTDIFCGYMLGALILLISLWLSLRIENWLVERGFGWQITISLLGPILLILLNPTGNQYVLSMISMLMAVSTGLALERRFVKFTCGGTWWKKATRYLVGVIVLLGLWSGLKFVFKGLEPGGLFLFIRYSLVGLWIVVGAPWIFVKQRLADRK